MKEEEKVEKEYEDEKVKQKPSELDVNPVIPRGRNKDRGKQKKQISISKSPNNAGAK